MWLKSRNNCVEKRYVYLNINVIYVEYISEQAVSTWRSCSANRHGHSWSSASDSVFLHLPHWSRLPAIASNLLTYCKCSVTNLHITRDRKFQQFTTIQSEVISPVSVLAGSPHVLWLLVPHSLDRGYMLSTSVCQTLYEFWVSVRSTQIKNNTPPTFTNWRNLGC